MKNWYLIKTKARQEKRAIKNLENQGYEVFCPFAKINTQDVPLFPGYLFIQLTDKTQNWSPINSTKGVSHFVKFGLYFARVSDNIIDLIKFNQKFTTEQLKNLKKFKSGDKVLINDGVFKNCNAIFKCFKSDERVILLMNLIGQQQTLIIKKDSVVAL